MFNVRIKTGDLRSDLREAVTAWIASLGLTPSDYADQFVILGNHFEGYELHLSKYRRAESGAIMLDRARGLPLADPVVVPAGHPSTWPTVGVEVAR